MTKARGFVKIEQRFNAPINKPATMIHLAIMVDPLAAFASSFPIADRQRQQGL
jgi:hypothetical protein